MSERVDVLIPAAAKLPYFTVDTGATEVDVTGFATLADIVLYTAQGASIFTKGDNFIIGSMGLIMPLSFQIDRKSTVSNPFITFLLVGNGVTTSNVYQFREIGVPGAAAVIYHIIENYDMAVDIFIDIQNQDVVSGGDIKNERFKLLMKLTYTGMKVSMAGVPDSLDGSIQRITPYVKIYHNFPLASS